MKVKLPAKSIVTLELQKIKGYYLLYYKQEDK